MPTPQEIQFYDDLDVKIAMNRGKNQPRSQPVKRPWEQKTVEKPASYDPGRADRQARLAERLGLGGVVDSDDKPDG